MKKFLFILTVAALSSNQVLLHGESQELHHCHYHTIKKFLDQYARTLTILFVGPITSTLPFQIAAHDKSICVMLDGDTNSRLQHCCSTCPSGNLILLKKAFTLQDLYQLAECEHFDIVVALNTLDRTAGAPQEILDHLCDLGDHTFIELSDTLHDTHQSYLTKQGATHLTSVNKRHLWIVSKEKTYLKRRNWGHYEITPAGRYTIKSTLKDKYLVKAARHGGHPTISPWQPGINLKTFKELNGTWPAKDLIYNELKTFKKTVEHNDLAIFNIVIQGKKDETYARLIPIDSNEAGRNARFSHHLKKILREFRSLSLYYLSDVLAEMKLPCSPHETDHDQPL